MKKIDVKKEIILITYIVLVIAALLNIKEICKTLGGFINILTPLWIGILIAIILNVPMSNLEKKYFKESTKLTRTLSIIISLLLFLIILYLLIFLIIPDFIQSISSLLVKLPDFVNDLKTNLLEHIDNKTLTSVVNNISSEITNIDKTKIINSIVNYSINFLTNVFSATFNIFTGLFIAIYLLMAKEKFISGISKFIKATFDKKIINKIIEYSKLSNKTFNKFISSQCVECLILGTIFFIILSILKIPYALTISFLICVTAIIPIFGATIACIVGAILIATVSINQAILYIIIFIIVQQIDNNFIYPKVVGKKVGLPAIITMLSVIVGGKLFGFIGMILCVPVTSIIYSIICEEVEKRLKN